MTSTKESIVNAAKKLFRNEGIRDVSVDMIAAEAKLTKRTIYYHFQSKDDIIADYLRACDELNITQFQTWFRETEGTVPDKVRGIFERLETLARNPRWKGCGFLRTSVELVKTPGHPALQAARQHKKRVETWLASELESYVSPGEAEAIAKEIMVLMEGAFSTVLLHRDPSYIQVAGDMARLLVERMQAAG
ncbi:TetR/AcrR family transcriptional regulator [Breoghania sp.]|uniref:TetR/AcrR family transcriptional regulator n=1 Tax=Breoghania sp. TaxID=2065378 RepID=UPI002AAB8554|nr:TetR/AcrR family transcriptional regulator [Breoghania sp.]